MTTAEGISYTFDVGVLRPASTLERRELVRAIVPTPVRDSLTGATSIVFAEEVIEVVRLLHRDRFYLLASKIEDRFGNTVQFSYNASGFPTRIWSNESPARDIRLAYQSGRLQSASSHGRTWQYVYSSPGSGSSMLDQVVLPDQSKWAYSYTGTLLPKVLDHEGLPQIECGGASPLSADFTLAATHPSGALGTFNFSNLRHVRNGVNINECLRVGATSGQDPGEVNYKLYVPYFYDVMSLTDKTITGPGLPQPLQWTFDYELPFPSMWGSRQVAPAYPCTTCASQTKAVDVVEPNGTRHRHTFGNLYQANDGRPLVEETFSAGGFACKRNDLTLCGRTNWRMDLAVRQ
ncbi:MAG: hypothetical protein HC794_03340 [Nitrospiraceae bacterium]|nr:hypothetical protein [Nitrospiraceae bacterium]